MKNPQIIKGYINLDKVQKDDIKKSKKGSLYLNVVLIPAKSEYGDDYMIVTDTPKDEKGTILGNGKFVGGKKRDDDSPSSSDGNQSFGALLNAKFDFE